MRDLWLVRGEREDLSILSTWVLIRASRNTTAEWRWDKLMLMTKRQEEELFYVI